MVPGPEGEKYINFGYGGFELEWIINSDKMLHFSVHSLIGSGWLNHTKDMHNNSGQNGGDNCFVLEPGVLADLNVTKFFRLSLGATYRYVNGIESPAASDASISGLSGVILLRFGKF
jgi:hypothetical protein